jgi:hypothetical protein
MKAVRWNRAEAIDSVRADIWRFITMAAVDEREAELEAAALLQLAPHEIRTLANIQFVNSPEVSTLLMQLPLLVRQLQVTSTAEEEISADRVRGPIQWTRTLSARAASGIPHLYVTAPARRAHDTPENEVLVYALNAIRTAGRRTGWHRSNSPTLGATVRKHVGEAERWLAMRTLAEIRPAPPSPHTIRRVRTGRAAKRYRAAVEVVELYTALIRRSDREKLRASVEGHALVASRNDVLLELMCGFAIERSLRKSGWSVSRPGLVKGGVFLKARHGRRRLKLYYQRAPQALTAGSVYREVQRGHQFAGIGGLIPDYVIKLEEGGSVRWIVVEVKGVEREVQKSARAALSDLLGYRRAFDPVLAEGPSPYALGIAWGKGLEPAPGAEIALCTPDRIDQALAQIFAA